MHLFKSANAANIQDDKSKLQPKPEIDAKNNFPPNTKRRKDEDYKNTSWQIEITFICKKIHKIFTTLWFSYLLESSFMGLVQLQLQKLLELFWKETEKVWYNDIDDDYDDGDNDTDDDDADLKMMSTFPHIDSTSSECGLLLAHRKCCYQHIKGTWGRSDYMLLHLIAHLVVL